MDAWERLESEIAGCTRCPRLRAYGAEVARTKRRAYRDQEYWGRPVPGFGDRTARVLLVGLAPGAHGAHRTGRMFTGDDSGAWLFEALHRAGLASQPASSSRDDGLRLQGGYLTASARCAPPGNTPTSGELGECAAYLEREVELLDRVRVVVALGGIAWSALIRLAAREDAAQLARPRPPFGHGAETRVVLRKGRAPVVLLGCYHPSRQNTNTGRLSRAMLDDVLHRAVKLAETVKNPAAPA